MLVCYFSAQSKKVGLNEQCKQLLRNHCLLPVLVEAEEL